MPMSKKYCVDKIHLLSIPRGEEIISYITRYVEENNIRTAIVTAIGSLYDVKIGYYSVEKDKYLEIKLNGYYELLSAIGNISLKYDKPFLHLHVTLGDHEGRVYGGHLLHGKVFVAETKIIELKGEPITRSKFTDTLWLWS